MVNKYVSTIGFFSKKTISKLLTSVFLLVAQFAFADCPLGLAPAITSSNLTYHNQDDGTITINETALTGVAPYSYVWASGSFGNVSSISGLSKAVYTVEVTDADNCTETATITITDPCDNVTFAPMVFNGSNPTYPTAADGSISLLNFGTLGGTAPLNYTWAPGSFGNTIQITGLTAGTYSLLVTDAKGCTGQGMETIVDAPCNLISQISNPLDEIGGFSYKPCQGATNGQLYVQTINNVGSLSYLWNSLASNQTTQVATGLGQGFYFVTVTDATTGCQSTTSIQLNESNFDWDVTITPFNPTTIGGSDGTATAAVNCTVCPTLGTDSYIWSNSQTSSFIFGLNQGVYTVTATLRNTLCQKTETVTLNDPSPCLVTASFTATTTVLCLGATTALTNTSANASTYEWKVNGGTFSTNPNETFTNTTVGNYTLSLTASNGTCNDEFTEIIYVVENPNPNLAVTNPTYHNTANGELAVSNALTLNGASPFNYVWSPGNLPNASSVSVLAAGNYTVVVTDANGCTAEATAMLVDPCDNVAYNAPLFSKNNPSFLGAQDGSITMISAIISLGTNLTAPLNYAWAGSSNITTSLTNIGAGTYTITITDAKGCTTSASETINNPSCTLTASFSIAPNDPAYCENLGQVEVFTSTTSGATSYDWQVNGVSANTTNTFTYNITTAGTYTISLIVSDGAGCTDTKNEIITVDAMPAAPTITRTGNVLTATTANNYKWFKDLNMIAGETSQTLTITENGTYHVSTYSASGFCAVQSINDIVVTDLGACPVTSDFTTTCTGLVDSTIVFTNTSSGGAITGEWKINGTTFASSLTTTSYVPSAIGTYTVELVASNGSCSTTKALIFEVFEAPTISRAGNLLTCNTNAIGYQWLKNGVEIQGEISPSYTMTSDGNYYVRVDVGCPSENIGAIISVNDYINTCGVAAAFDGPCIHKANNTINFTNSSTGAINYSWTVNGIEESTSQNFNKIFSTAGTYTVNLIATNGACQDIETKTITVYDKPTITRNGSIITATTNPSTLFIAWFVNGQFKSDVLLSNTFTIDQNGTYEAAVFESGDLSTCSYKSDVLSVNDFGCNLQAAISAPLDEIGGSSYKPCTGSSNGQLFVQTLGEVGTLSYEWDNGQTTQLASNLAAGTYSVTVTDAANACTSTATIVLNESNFNAILTTSKFDPSTAVATDGSATVNVNCSNCSSATHAYLWDNGQTTQTATGLGVGTYTVTVTIANTLCTKTASVTLSPPAPCGYANIKGTLTSVNPTSGAATDGSVTISSVFGGQTPYTYLWSDAGNSTTTSVQNLSKGGYTLTITDAGNCSVTTTTMLVDPANPCDGISLTPTIVYTSTTLPGGADGTATIKRVDGGQPAYTYKWTHYFLGNIQNTDATLAANNVFPGTYTVTITDNNGCSGAATATIADIAGSNWCDIGGGVKIPGGADDSDIFGSFAKCATMYKNELYVGGNFTQAGSTSAFLLAKWDGTNWSQVGGGLGLYVAPLEGFLGTPSVDALCEYNGDLYVGGIFNRANGQVTKYLAKWDGTNWSDVGGGLNSYVHALHVYNNELYVGGYFDTVNVVIPANKMKAQGIVKWDGSNWSTLGAGLALNTTSARAYITALATYNSELYVGGNFENSGGTPISGIAKWTGSNWSAVGSGNQLSVVSALAVYNNKLYSGGQGVNNTYLEAWDGASWTTQIGNYKPEGHVNTLYVLNNALYMGGRFSGLSDITIGNPSKYVSGIAKWDGNSWNALAIGGVHGEFKTSVSYNTGSVNFLSAYQGKILVGGQFTSAGSSTIKNLAVECGGVANSCAGVNIIINETVTNPTTVGGNNGSIDANNVNGGQAPYAYNWSNTQTTSIITSLNANTYTVTVTDANSCSATKVITLTVQPPTCNLQAAISAPFDEIGGNSYKPCAGASNGQLLVQTTGEVGNLSYLWDNGQTTALASNLAAGTYAVTVTDDANNCTSTTTIVLAESNFDWTISATPFNPTTVGGNDGSITSTVNCVTCPSVGTNSYAWSNTETTQDITGLTADTYILTVTLKNTLCTKTTSVVLVDPSVGCAFDAAISAPLDTIGGSSYKPCPSAANGQLTVYVTSGAGPYFFLWSNTQAGTTVNDTLNYINNLISDSYTVTVTDNSGCSKTAELFLPESAFNFNLGISKLDPTTVGGNDGSATAVVSCPDCFTEMVNHTYLWSPTGQTTETATNLVAGTYTVTVTLAKTLCVNEHYRSLYDPGQCAITVGFTPSETVLCNADSLYLTNTSTGNNIVYSWLANGVEFSTQESPVLKVANDAPLNIKLIATDGTCIDSAEADIVVKQSPFIRPSIVQFGTKLVATEHSDYQWYLVGGGDVAGATNRNYTIPNNGESFYVQVDSINGCSAYSDTIITNIVPMPGGGNATINSTCTELGPYYWGGELDGIPAGSLVASANGKAQALGSDVIRITLASNNDIVYTGGNCITGSNLTALASRADFNSIITDPQYKTVIITAYDWASFGDCNSKNYLDTNFYTPTNKAAIQQEIADLADYLKQFTDKKFIITNWEGDNDIYCGSSSKFYFDQLPCSNYLSSAVAMQKWLQARKAGVDQVGASNVKFGVEFVTTLLLEEKGYPNILHDILPYVGADYFLYSAYESQFYGPSRIASDIDYIRSKLVSYGYDANKLLIGETGFDINTPDAKVKLQDAVDVFKQKNIPTAVVWTLLQAAANPGDYGVYDNFGNLTDYGTVIPTNLCAVTCTVDAKFNSSSAATTICAGTTINFTNTSTDALNYDWQLNGVSFATTANASFDALTPGTYTVSLIASAGSCKDTMKVVFNVKQVAFTTTATNAACGSANGSASVVNPSGGTGAYSYLWVPGSTTGAAITAIAAGSYTVNVIDANSCSTSSVVVISNTGAPIISVSTVSATCNGQNNGSASVTIVSGGTSPFTYSWSNTSTSQAINNVVGATYIVTVRDALGCNAVATAVVSQPAAISYNTTINNASCSATNGSAVLSNVTGGTSPYTIAWSSGTSTGVTSSPLGAGTYGVTVTDNQGCSKTTTFAISNTGAPILTATVIQPISCNGGSNAIAQATATGGIFPYQYTWDNGSSGQSASPLGVGTFTVTVTDANQCKAIATVAVSQPQIIGIGFNIISPACGGTNGAVSSTISGGTMPYTYAWDNLSTTASISALTAGTYTLTVTDTKSCTATSTVVVGNGTPVTATASATNSTICSGASTQLNSSGGTTFAWLPANSVSNAAINNPTATPTSNTTYTVTVSNVSGCSATSTVLVGVITIAPATITQSGSTLTSSAGAGNQWYKDGALISGATSTTYIPTQNGVYTVIVTIAGCTSTPSNAINVVLSGINAVTDGVTQLLAYPNPAKDEVELKLIGLQDEQAVITMYNPFGQLVYTQQVSAKRGNEYRTKISLANYPSGVYWIQVNTKQTNLVQKLIVN